MLATAQVEHKTTALDLHSRRAAKIKHALSPDSIQRKMELLPILISFWIGRKPVLKIDDFLVAPRRMVCGLQAVSSPVEVNVENAPRSFLFTGKGWGHVFKER
ncbi:MAG: hypothetical protein ICV60_21595 [Pyrinomonadaceae bacterium]|nr:hypothetical protein [Pyrinomonadaceae bacterium]